LIGKRIADFAAYIIIGLAVGLTAFVFAICDIDAKWMALVFQTALVFGCLISWSRRLWKVPGFWLFVLASVIAHLVLMITIVHMTEKFRAFWVSATFVVEASILIYLADRFSQWFLRRGSGGRRHQAPR
jgi:hypothetical protein